ncbi:C1QL [Mytilus coruscus]|uniref:C1QL n=1 Tax=Mytilus coruscus TaxID=42192 RepID=A0A6J8DW27_MYTCO|nr:C1QL [Mytilus coruscus]
MICSCKCQDLEKFVAPVLDNRGAPLVAIVDTTNISSHIVRSIEMPLREIINSTIECKINEELKTVKQDIATLRMDTEEIFSHEILERKNFTNIVDTVKADLDEEVKNFKKHVDLMKSGLQQTIDEHTEVKQDIVTLQKEIKETITNEILKQVMNLTKIVNTVNIDLDEKVKNLNNNVDIVQSELRKTILSVNYNASNLAEQLKTHSNRLDALRSSILELIVNTSAIQNDVNNVRSNDGRLRVHVTRLDHLNAKVNAINARERLHVVAFYAYLSTNRVNPSFHQTLIYDVAKTNSGNGYNAATGIFTAPTTGIYVFTWVTRMYEATYSTELMVNNAVVGTSFLRVSHDHDVSASGTVVTKISKGDSVFVRVHSTKGGWGDILSEQYGRSSFAGWLLH